MGPCTANARRPTVDSRCRGTTVSCCVADLRRCLPTTSVTGVQQSISGLWRSDAVAPSAPHWPLASPLAPPPLLPVDVSSENLPCAERRHRYGLDMRSLMGLLQLRYEHDTSTIRVRFDYDSTTIRLQHATTRYEVFRALAYEIVYENQW